MLMIFGALLLALGLWLSFGPPVPWLGRLPGDIHVERPGFRFDFPVVTCLLLSVVLSLLLYLFGKLR